MPRDLQHNYRQLEGEYSEKKRNNAGYYIAGFLLVVWFVAFVFFNAAPPVHVIFLAGILMMIYKLFQDYKNRL